MKNRKTKSMGEMHSTAKIFASALSKKWKILALSTLILVVVLVGLLNVHPRLQAVHAASGDWLTYMGDSGRHGYNSAETIINPTSASNLKLHWTSTAGGGIFSQPTVANGMIYWGSLDGYEHATTLNGTQVWQQYLGHVTQCSPLPSLGVVSSATVATETINGTSTSVVFVAGGDDHLYALNASTGSIIWSTAVGNPSSNTFMWDSPLVSNNSVYIGIATDGEPNCALIPAQFVQMDVATGTIQHTFNTIPNGCLGGGIWSSPTLDSSDNSIYITTGTQGSFHTCKEPYAIAIVKLRASDLSFIDSWQIPVADRGSDSDFGATPTLFNATIAGTQHKLVGAVNKNGTYYAWDRTALHNGPVWTANVAIAGNCPQCGAGSISSSAWNGSALFEATTKTTIKGITCKGSLRALNPANGAFIWERCLTDGPVLGSVTIVPGVAAVVEGPNLVLISTVTGKILFNALSAGIPSHFYGAPSISNGVLYVGSTSNKLYALGI